MGRAWLDHSGSELAGRASLLLCGSLRVGVGGFLSGNQPCPVSSQTLKFGVRGMMFPCERGVWLASASGSPQTSAQIGTPKEARPLGSSTKWVLASCTWHLLCAALEVDAL